MPAKFGPAGNSESFSANYKSTVQAPGYLENMGLDHYEYQCGRGVKVTDKTAIALRDKAAEHNISLSLHAPYFISLSSIEPEKRDNSIDYILQSCDAAKRLGAQRIVIHSGSCAKISREEALELAKDTITRARKAAIEQGFE
ncbi:MAG: TIM barrel protein, partial [Ruminococcus sp.]|nr:TIM barrel protein [Ruminococcus sp.]